MANDQYSRVRFTEGEGVVADDFELLATHPLARLYDQVLQHLPGSVAPGTGLDPELSGQNGANVPTRWCYCLSPGSAFLRAGSAANRIQVAPGTLLQKVGTTDGQNATLLSYSFSGTEEWSITNGDGSNPRVDLLQLKLELAATNLVSRDFEDAVSRVVTSQQLFKWQQVQATLTVKQGTPAASPQVPELDSGCVAVGTVVVGTSYVTSTARIFGVDTAGAQAVVHDQRMPLRVRAHTVQPVAFNLITNWSLTSGNLSVNASSSTNELYAVCPAGVGRLVGVAVPRLDGATGVTGQTLARRTIGPTTTSFLSLSTLTNLSGATNISTDVVPWSTFEAAHSPSAGPTVVQSSTGKLGVPIWANGRRSPYEVQRLESAGTRPYDQLIYRVVNSSQSAGDPDIFAVTFYVAEGI